MTASAQREAQPVRIGFIGCGRNAQGHMRSLLSVPGARIVGVCDVSSEAAQSASRLSGGQPYEDFRALLERDDLDAVYLSLPAFAHGAPELATIERGLPFFVEKPVAVDTETAQRVQGALAKKDLITCVGYQLRYRGGTDAARALIAASTEGPVGIAAGSYWCGTGRALGNTWRTRMAESGGQILEQATHTLDLMRFLVGEVDEVFAYFSRAILPKAEGGDCPDVHAVSLRFASGAVGTLSATWAIDPADWGNANVLQIGHGVERLQWTANGLTRTRGTQTEEVALGPDGNIDAIFVEAVRTGDRSSIRSDYADGVRSLALCVAINESGATGKPVRLNDTRSA
jgi:myo-inositol 2-dehydrogenase / D-chiro-inositol 1-dehydrogenase